MEYRELGDSGLKVSEIALGCWPFAGGAFWGDQNEDDSIATVHAALDNGINFFDSAEAYETGESDRVLGRALKGRREQAIVTTKVSRKHLQPDLVIEACDRSLKNLQMDYVDLYQIHWPNHDVALADTVEALLKLKKQGKIRAIGVSNFACGDLSEMLELCKPVSNQMPYSLLWRGIERDVKPMCQENDIGILAYSSLAQGLLTGRYASADDVPDHLAQPRWYSGDRPNAIHGEAGHEHETFSAIGQIKALADELGLSMATLALAWVRSRPGISSFLVGARNPTELGWNLPVTSVKLDADVIARLDGMTDDLKQKLGSNLDMWMAPGRMR